MEPKRLSAKDVLSPVTKFPNEEAARRLGRLVGVDHHVESLVRDLRLIFDPELATDWSTTHYGKELPAVEILTDTVPLIVFEGDVGTGKTALADSIAEPVSEDGGYGVHVVKMSTRVRGTGYVGEMGTLLAESFQHVASIWKKVGEPVLFIIDEADSLLTSREFVQHHHEDKSGVNTIIQHLDEFRRGSEQIAVIAITNRIGVLDPAILRRATAVHSFERPGLEQRAALFARLFDGAGFTEADLAKLAEASEPRKRDGEPLRFSYSDLTLRFAVPALREAIHRKTPLDVSALASRLRELSPTRAMEDL